MKNILAELFEHKTLDQQRAYDILVQISEEKYNVSEVAAFLTVFQMRTITVDELTGFRNALHDLCVPVDLSAFNPIDLCGTGGDGKNTFNISTLAAFVVAGAGVKVAKHGNYGVSSVCGSSNVMEHLGYTFTNDVSTLTSQIDNHNICFLHAPLFHPAMKFAAPIRRELGFKTFFNMLGPMVNPAKPKRQTTGVFSLELARLYQYIFQNDVGKQFTIIHALDGYDEISLTGSFKLINNEGEKVMHPKDLYLNTVTQEKLYGGETIKEAAKLFVDILEGKGTDAQKNVVIANAAVSIHCVHQNKDLEDCLLLAGESLESGRAFEVFRELVG